MFDVLDLVVHQNDVGLFEGGVGAARAHADGDVGGDEARRVVDSVADHRDFLPGGAPIVNALELCLRRHFGADVIDADLACD